MTDDDEDSEIANFSAARARRFLRSLQNNPFVAVVIEGDRVHVFTKGQLTEEEMAVVTEVLSEIEREDGKDDKIQKP